MSINMKEIRERMDMLSIRSLEVMEEILKERNLLNGHLKDAFLNLAKSRYNMGNTSVGISQLPNEDTQVEPLYKVDTQNDQGNFDEFNLISVSQFKENNDEETEESRVRRRGNKELENNAENRKEKNPLNWFGILVPGTLKRSQIAFQSCLGNLCRIATLQSELINVCGEFRELRQKKNHVAN